MSLSRSSQSSAQDATRLFSGSVLVPARIRILGASVTSSWVVFTAEVKNGVVLPDQPLVFNDLPSGMYTRWEMEVEGSAWTTHGTHHNIYFERYVQVATGDLDPCAVWRGETLSIEFSAML